MRRFLAGAASMLILVLIAFTTLYLTLRDPGSTLHPVPLGPGVRPAGPPSDLGPDETWLGDVDLSSSSLMTPGGALRDVHAKGTDVRVTRTGLRVGTLSLDAVLPFEVAAAQIGDGISLYDAGGGLVGISRTATVLGQDVRIGTTGEVRAENGDLVVVPRTVDVGGPGFINEALGNAARDLVTIRQTVRGLPAGTRLTAVTVGANGFRAHLVGNDVVIAGG